MLRYYKEIAVAGSSSSPTLPKENSNSIPNERLVPDIEPDPGLRPPITSFDPNIQDDIRMAYLKKPLCQPVNHNFPTRMIDKPRKFSPTWYKGCENWLEYSIAKNKVYCLFCYLFKSDVGSQGGGNVFVSKGFDNWKRKDKLKTQIGEVNSIHNFATAKCLTLQNTRRSISSVLNKVSNDNSSDYVLRLNTSIDCIRFLLRQGLAFWGHDEFEESINQGNFLELLKFLADHDENVEAVALKNAPENHKLISPAIKNDIVKACATEVSLRIVKELGDKKFSILVDECRDLSVKEQMAVVIRYVDDHGLVVERFLGVKHVTSTDTLSLKKAVDHLLSTHSLSISSLRGQGYDGASNMQGEFNGLKAIILRENESAHFVHCFAHRLQLALVSVARDHSRVSDFFNLVTRIVNVVGASCKRRDLLRENHMAKVVQGLSKNQIVSGKGLNQEITLQRAADTRWGSHYGTLLSLRGMFSSVLDVLEIIEEDGIKKDQRGEALKLLKEMQCFEFVFNLHLMISLLSITNELSQALQRKDQDIVNAMKLVKASKEQLQVMRDDGWSLLMDEINLFCGEFRIIVPDMNDLYFEEGRKRRRIQFTNYDLYKVELFVAVTDLQSQELNNRFNELNTKLLLTMACLNPVDSFAAFDINMLVRFANLYPNDFSDIALGNSWRVEKLYL